MVVSVEAWALLLSSGRAGARVAQAFGAGWPWGPTPADENVKQVRLCSLEGSTAESD